MSTNTLNSEILEHARRKLSKVALGHVRGGMGPERAARAAIHETLALFPPDWHLVVQGDDDDDFVEVWEREHKLTSPVATIKAAKKKFA